jgi:ribosomal protein S3AE
VDGAREAIILQKIDHHVEGDIADATIPYVRREMIGSTNTIIYECFKELGINIDNETARIMLSGIVSDTRNLSKTITSRIDTITDATTKDGQKINVHMLAITVKRAKASQQRYIRETMQNMILEAAAEKTLDELVKEIISGKFASNIYHEAKKIYPLKKVETIKTRVL